MSARSSPAKPVASADPIAVELDPGEGRRARVEWDPESLMRLDARRSTEGQRVWRLDGELDADAFETLRVISAAFEDGHALAVAALRPVRAEGHGAESVGGVLVRPEGERVELAQALVSTEYRSDGLPERIGLELYPDPEAPPLRVAGERVGIASQGGHARPPAVAMELRMEGVRGVAIAESVRP